jgi:hypothetical protein
MPKPRRKMLKPIPSFANEDQEAEFWSSADHVSLLRWCFPARHLPVPR